MTIPVIAVFDIGRTNKKIFLFDEHYHIRYEKETHLPETKDEDGYQCQDIAALKTWVLQSIKEVARFPEFEIKAISISAHGASFVNINEHGEPVTPLYNYLKPFPDYLQKKLYGDYGINLPKITASPSLGNLNSGLQLYRLRYEKPEVFDKIKYALHLPQYIGYLLTGKVSSDMTSIGCHTQLWNFETNQYHDWVSREEISSRLAPVRSANEVTAITLNDNHVLVGIGLHDSSAALIPYLKNFTDPFVLISTGTWCITLNPFNPHPLTDEELQKDCLCYLSFEGKPVKASRLFAGQEHEDQVKRIAVHFNKEDGFYKSIAYHKNLADQLLEQTKPLPENEFHGGTSGSDFAQRNLTFFDSAEQAYHQLLIDIVNQQAISTQLVLKKTNVNRIFVDGGFSKSPIYMNLLAKAFPKMNVYGASMAQASALGAALAVHEHWNTQPLPENLISLVAYRSAPVTTL